MSELAVLLNRELPDIGCVVEASMAGMTRLLGYVPDRSFDQVNGRRAGAWRSVPQISDSAVSSRLPRSSDIGATID